MSLILNIAVTNNQFELITPMYQAVTKRLEYIRYGRIIPAEDIPLEYVAFDPLDARTTLSIRYLESEFRNNNKRVTRNADKATAISGKRFSSDVSNVLITSEYQVLDDGTVIPYFYSHQLPADTVAVSVQRVTRNGTEQVDTTEYVVNSAKTVVFASFLNQFDEVSGRYTVYYIESVNGSGEYTTELYNPSIAFHEATFDDIDPVTGMLFQDTNAYVINSVGSQFTYTLPISDTYYIREETDTRIRLLPPALTGADDPWIARITTGNFNETIEDISYNYFIEEYDLQIFVPSAPTKVASNESVIQVTDSLIKLQREDIKIDVDSGLDIDLIISSANDGAILYALTTDSAKSGTTYGDSDIEFDDTKIADWDNRLGIVRIDDLRIKEEYEIKAFYFYDEYAYEYTTINLNPIFSPELEGKMVVIYVVPNTKGTGESSIYHLVVKDNVILSTSQTGGTVVPNLSPYTEAGVPNEDSVIGLQFKSDGTSGSGAFEDRYPTYLILAEINILEPSRISDAVRVDIRSPGGIINPDYLDDAINANSRIAYLAGVAPIGGYGFPQNATHVVRVPYTLLTDYGGELTETIVRDRVQKNMAAGEYPIIEFSGVIPEIYAIEPSTCITLNWYQEDPTYSFKIYRSLNIDSGFALLATVAGSSYNSNEYIDCSVTSGVAYYYYITALSSDNIESPKSVTWGARAL